MNSRVGPGYRIAAYRTARCFEKFEGGQEYPFLKDRIVRQTKGPAQLKGDPQGPRRFDGFRMQADKADLRRWQTLILQEISERAHGARAQRSHGYEQNGIDPIFF